MVNVIVPHNMVKHTGTIRLNVLDHFVGLALKELIDYSKIDALKIAVSL